MIRPFTALLLILIGCSVTFAADVNVERDVVYGKAGDVELMADIYSPAEASAEPLPVVLLVHGGGWRGGNRQAGAEVALAHHLVPHGYVAVSISYRLVGRDAEGKLVNQWPAAIDDCRQAVRWIRENAEKLNIDPSRIGAAGDSAGGHLVSLLGTTDVAASGETSTRVQAVVNIYGPADLRDKATADAISGNPAVKQMVDEFVGEGPTQAKIDASPLLHIDDKTVPILTFQGDKDALVSYQQSVEFDAALRKAGRDSKLVMYENEGHGFSGPTFRKMLLETRNFFDKHLKPEDANN
ncbi:alpha/beta hydrolase [Bremerella sp. JC817]|uniref:alpha/beta hydrolase n=1 Tax=Bremerella sp. JC817 TaxID=3231756 RepID=UPI0034576CDC